MTNHIIVFNIENGVMYPSGNVDHESGFFKLIRIVNHRTYKSYEFEFSYNRKRNSRFVFSNRIIYEIPKLVSIPNYDKILSDYIIREIHSK